MYITDFVANCTYIIFSYYLVSPKSFSMLSYAYSIINLIRLSKKLSRCYVDCVT